tara:strand:+ start:363 stop:701 length:339 start_codon:yes stop_codon:yes gene_type:complete
MLNQHPITPPLELAEEWRMDYMGRGHAFIDVAIKAVQYGADQELEACCEWLCNVERWKTVAEGLRTSRRPKPPSLKEQARDALDTYIYGEPDPKDKERTYNTIRRALETLDD